MDWLEREGFGFNDPAENYRKFVEGDRKGWSSYIRKVVEQTQYRLGEMKEVYDKGDFYSDFWGGPDNIRYNFEVKKIQANGWKRIQVGLKTKPSIAGKVKDVIIRPSSKGYPLGDPKNHDSIVILCSKPRRGLTLMIPLLPEWGEAKKGDSVKFFADERYYRAELTKKKDGDSNG